MQTKDLALAECELKFAARSGSFEGYASTFHNVDSYGDTIIPGAYRDTLANRSRPPLMLFGHSAGRVIGKWTAMSEDSKGLLVAGELTPGHTDAQNVGASLKHGALSGLSIGFRIPKGGSEELKAADNGATRALKKIDLIEVSVVSMPADDAARIDAQSVKAAIDSLKTISDMEGFLRDVGGLSKSGAKAMLSRFKAITRRDDGDSAAMKSEIERLMLELASYRGREIVSRFPFPTLRG